MNVADTTTPEPPATLGRWAIPHLYRYWQRAITVQTGPTPPNTEWDIDNTLLSGLDLNILETSRYLNNNRHSSFEAFEDWILATNDGAIKESRLNRLRDALAGLPVDSPAGSLGHVPGLTDNELAFFDEHGYVVVHDAVVPEDRDAAAAAIYEFLDADPSRPDTWYGNKFGKSIWVPLLRHPAFLNNRNSPRLVKAFAQLWGREDLWSTVDQGGLNPPERDDWKFPGPHVHWDMSLVPPHHFGVHGILYLTDTPADQGAFSCIPGFHRHLAQWLEALPPGEDPRHAVFNHPGLKPIAGRAGDLVIWHNSLPHASSPNHGKLPRVVQYITLRPTRWPFALEWK